MALSSSLAAKVGGGLAIGFVGTTGTYYTVKHFTGDSLYEVEREILEKSEKLKVEAITGNKSIKIFADTTETNPQLTKGEWVCIINSNPDGIFTSHISDLVKRIQSNLQKEGPISEDQFKENKFKLIEGCAKHRTGSPKHNSVSDSLTLRSNTQTPSKFTFGEYSELDFLLNNALYEVEEKVIKGEVGLEVSDVSGSNSKKVKVSTVSKESLWGEGDDKNYYWECVISGPNAPTLTIQSWQDKLFKEETQKAQNLSNNVILVRKCSENRDSTTTPTNQKVKAKLDLTTVTGKSSESELITHVFG